MARLFYGSIQSEGVRIHYYRTGDEKPPVVLLHGFSDNGLCWGRLALYLEPDYDVVMIDARGHGLSDAPETGYTPKTQAADVAAVIRQLQLYKPVVVGHSMGAQTAAVAAGLYPELVGSVVLEDPPWRADFESTGQSRLDWLSKRREWLESVRSMTLDELVELGKRENPRWDESELFQWAKSKQQVKMQVLAMSGEPPIPWREVASKINLPVMLITGDTGLGAIVTPEIAKEAAAMWRKKGTHIHVPGAGHNIRRENFGPFLNAVTHFIARQ